MGRGEIVRLVDLFVGVRKITYQVPRQSYCSRGTAQFGPSYCTANHLIEGRVLKYKRSSLVLLAFSLS